MSAIIIPGIVRKAELVHLVNTSPISASQVSGIENVKYSTLRKYRRLAANSKPFFEKNGRPPLIDDLSINYMLSNLQDNGDFITNIYFKGLLMQERTNTYVRRFGHQDIGLRPISKATINKYLKYFADRLSVIYERQVCVIRRNRPRRVIYQRLHLTPQSPEELHGSTSVVVNSLSDDHQSMPPVASEHHAFQRPEALR